MNDGADMSACLALILELLQAPVHMPEALKTGGTELQNS